MPDASRSFIKHLYLRAGMGLRPDELDALGDRTADQVIDGLFAGSAGRVDPIITAHTTTTAAAYRKAKAAEKNALLRANREETGRLNLQWAGQLARTEGCLREKMAFFWHGHFACWSHWSQNAGHYLHIVREHALGDFGTLLRAVSKSPAMLEYLNNRINRKAAPNENFAREVMELFTLGRGHYTEQDIKEAARAFTGWTFEPGNTELIFRQEWHDTGTKTFRGRSGNFDGDDILDMILADRRCADHICARLYRSLVNPVDDAAFIARMSERFFASGYDIADLLRFVFSSAHFAEPHHYGARIKSPIELLCGLEKVLPVTHTDANAPLFLQRSFGQVLLHPPSVAGWTEHTGWIDSNSLIARLKLPSALLNGGQLEWEEPGESAEDMDRMVYTADAPLRDARGRRISATVDKQPWLASGIAADDDRLCDALLAVPASDALRKALPRDDAWQRTLVVLSSPEYQLC